MFETLYAQLRFAGSLLFARPFHQPSLDRLIDGIIATYEAFGSLTGETHTLLQGPALDERTRRQIQLRRFRSQAVRAAQETPYYADLFQRLALDPARLAEAQIGQIPLTTKAALRAEPEACVRCGQRPTLRALTTGTTGRSTNFYFTRRELDAFAALAAISHLMQGSVLPDDVVQVSTSARGALANSVFMAACQRIGALVYQTGLVEPEQTLALLAERHDLPGKKSRASVLLTYPSYLGRLVTCGLRLGYTPDDFGLERILLGGEVVTDAVVRRCQALFGDVEIDEVYGITEVYPFGGKACEAGHLHFEPSAGLMEMVDPESGRPVAPGAVGALVLTPFAPYREATVLLRYDTGDLVRSPAEPPACSLRHLPATDRPLGKRRLAQRHADGWVTPRAVLEAVESVEAIPLPARCGFACEGDGVMVEVAVPAITDGLRRRIEANLRARGVPLCDLRLVTDPARLVDPLPLRGDLHERTFVRSPRVDPPGKQPQYANVHSTALAPSTPEPLRF